MSSPVPASLRTVPGPAGPGLSTRLVLVRHGEATCNVRGVVGGRRGCTGLSALGLRQARALERRLEESGELAHASVLYASVLPRAVQTAAVIRGAVGHGALPVVEDCALCELHPGDADGLRWEEFTEAFGEPAWDEDPDTLIAPGGESWSGFVARAAGGLAAVARRHRGATAVVVCHAGVIEAAILRFLPVAAGRRRLGLRTEHTSLTEWEVTDEHGQITGEEVPGTGPSPGTGTWRLLRYNDAAHLPGPTG
jgi:probable phosphoglycerate mutase